MPTASSTNAGKTIDSASNELALLEKKFPIGKKISLQGEQATQINQVVGNNYTIKLELHKNKSIIFSRIFEKTGNQITVASTNSNPSNVTIFAPVNFILNPPDNAMSVILQGRLNGDLKISPETESMKLLKLWPIIKQLSKG